MWPGGYTQTQGDLCRVDVSPVSGTSGVTNYTYDPTNQLATVT